MNVTEAILFIIEFIKKKLLIAFDRDITTTVGEANGPNVTIGDDDVATNCIIDSFLRSIYYSRKINDHQTDQ